MSGLESLPHGDEIARQFKESVQEPLMLDDPRVQVYLAKIAFPQAEKPMNLWVAGDETTGIPPLSGSYRDYVEEMKSSGGVATVDIRDEKALSELLTAVQARVARTVH